MVILNNLCVLFMQKNDTVEALRYIRNAYEVFLKQQTPPEDHAQLIVILNLVELYIRNGQLNEAVNIYACLLYTSLDIASDYYDDVLVIPKVDKLIQGILTVIPLQLMAYEIARLRGCEIDQPRNLAKSVTVE